MKINEIYKKFGIPPNLQEHMHRVCGVVSLIEKHWKGQERVDWFFVKKISLLHDLGNVVKFDLDKNPEFLGNEQANLEYWKKAQSQTIVKYGSDDHEVTRKMLAEVGIGQEAINVILSKSFGNSVETEKSNNWPLKILYYADLRTLPFGIGTLEERISDVRERMPKYTSRPDFKDLISSCKEIESQIQNNLDISTSGIDNKSVNEEITLNHNFIENLDI